MPREIVILLLKGVTYGHTEFRSLEEFLVKKCGFRKVEREAPEEADEVPLPSEFYEGVYLGVKVKACFLGTVQRVDFVQINEGERYPIYVAEYRMVKLVSESGYSLQRLIEQLNVDLGLKVKNMEWLFHRCSES